MAQAQQAGEPNRTQPKKVGKPRFAHVANTKYGMGDYYGTGVKNKVGKMREGVGNRPVSPSKLKSPPRSLA